MKEEWLVQKFDHELRWLERFDFVQAEPPFPDLFIRQEGKWRLDLLTGFYKGPVIIYRLGEGGGFGAKQGDSPFYCYFTEAIPPNNFWWLSQSPPHVFTFQANLSGPPSEPFQSFQRFPLSGSQLRLIPPFVLLKIKWSPLKSSVPPPPPSPNAINNDRSLSRISPFELPPRWCI